MPRFKPKPITGEQLILLEPPTSAAHRRQKSRPRQKLKPLRFGLPEYGPHLEVHQRILWSEELRIQRYQ
jgi:hypothetical protein